MVSMLVFQGATTSTLADVCSGDSWPDTDKEKMKKALKQEDWGAAIALFDGTLIC